MFLGCCFWLFVFSLVFFLVFLDVVFSLLFICMCGFGVYRVLLCLVFVWCVSFSGDGGSFHHVVPSDAIALFKPQRTKAGMK